MSTVKSNSESENDDCLMKDDSDEVNDAQGDEAGNEDEATNKNEQGNKHNELFNTQSRHKASSAVSASRVALPDLLPKKGTKF